MGAEPVILRGHEIDQSSTEYGSDRERRPYGAAAPEGTETRTPGM